MDSCSAIPPGLKVLNAEVLRLEIRVNQNAEQMAGVISWIFWPTIPTKLSTTTLSEASSSWELHLCVCGCVSPYASMGPPGNSDDDH